MALGDVLLAFVRRGKKHVPDTQTVEEAASGPAREGHSRRAKRRR